MGWPQAFLPCIFFLILSIGKIVLFCIESLQVCLRSKNMRTDEQHLQKNVPRGLKILLRTFNGVDKKHILLLSKHNNPTLTGIIFKILVGKMTAFCLNLASLCLFISPETSKDNSISRFYPWKIELSSVTGVFVEKWAPPPNDKQQTPPVII